MLLFKLNTSGNKRSLLLTFSVMKLVIRRVVNVFCRFWFHGGSDFGWEKCHCAWTVISLLEATFNGRNKIVKIKPAAR